MVELPPIQFTIERAWREVAAIEEAFERGDIDQAQWHARMASLVVPAYLAGDNPRAQAGYTGAEADWEQARSLVAEAVCRSGTFLDIGCANGLLMESVWTWCAMRGHDVHPYGLEIAPELATLARNRIPQWADRVFEGNAADWLPHFRFDFVRTGADYVPRAKRQELIRHLLSVVLQPGGRLIIGPYTEERNETRSEASLENMVTTWGFDVSGRIERHHFRDSRVIRRLIFIDAKI